MRFLLRLVGTLVILYAGLSIVRRLLDAFTPAAQVKAPSGAGHLVKDPVCGTYVPQETALHVGDQYFCSEACRHKFELNAG